MSKQIEKLKKQLLEVSEVVNAFQSEAVQVKIITWLLDEITDEERGEVDGAEGFAKRNKKTRSDDQPSGMVQGKKKPGATKILNQLLNTDFFDTARSISSIADYCKEQYDSEFKTSELSGILLKLAKENKLRRERSNENNRFEYVRA